MSCYENHLLHQRQVVLRKSKKKLVNVTCLKRGFSVTSRIVFFKDQENMFIHVYISLRYNTYRYLNRKYCVSEFDDILKCLSYFSGKILSLVRNRQCHLHETIQIRVRLQVLQHYPHYWRGKWTNELIILQSPTYPIEFTILFQKFAFNQSSLLE